jgi:hypothetical protein
MAEASQIKYLTNKEIDWNKWDACITNAPNGLIYAYSIYLSQMAKQCDALVLDDYDAVMPLTWNKKYGFYYLYQPAFTASLGVFGKNISEQTVKHFLTATPSKFRLTEISLNHQNNFPRVIDGYYSRSNYILHLNKPYEELLKSYRDNHKRNISKSIQAGCRVNNEINVNDVIRLHQEFLNHADHTNQHDHSNFIALYHLLRKTETKKIDAKINAMVYGITDPQNKIMASAVFFFSHNRAYYILVGNHPDGKTIGASHALIDAFIKDHAGKDLILDFEGSDIRNLAFFYSGFGAKEEIYPAIKINRLPWYIRLFKK